MRILPVTGGVDMEAGLFQIRTGNNLVPIIFLLQQTFKWA